MNEIKFYKEKNTNNIITSLNGNIDSDNYTLLKANTTDGAIEKHVPVYEVINNEIKVSVGSTIHPMSEEHYIMWIALVSDKEITIKKFNPIDIPETTFEYISNSKIYAYCNLHGLWSKDVK